MALDIGTAEDSTGLAGALKTAIVDALETTFGDDFDAESEYTAPGLNALANGLAKGVVEYLIANAEIAVTVNSENGTGTLS